MQQMLVCYTGEEEEEERKANYAHSSISNFLFFHLPYYLFSRHALLLF